MSRRIIAFIDADDEKLLSLHPEDGVGAAFEKEMGWVKPCGIQVADWAVADDDDEVMYGRYITYLFQWAMDHAAEESGSSPLTFDQWKEKQG